MPLRLVRGWCVAGEQHNHWDSSQNLWMAPYSEEKSEILELSLYRLICMPFRPSIERGENYRVRCSTICAKVEPLPTSPTPNIHASSRVNHIWCIIKNIFVLYEHSYGSGQCFQFIWENLCFTRHFQRYLLNIFRYFVHLQLKKV
jgi:hypothetical protein